MKNTLKIVCGDMLDDGCVPVNCKKKSNFFLNTLYFSIRFDRPVVQVRSGGGRANSSSGAAGYERRDSSFGHLMGHYSPSHGRSGPYLLPPPPSIPQHSPLAYCDSHRYISQAMLCFFY